MTIGIGISDKSATTTNAVVVTPPQHLSGLLQSSSPLVSGVQEKQDHKDGKDVKTTPDQSFDVVIAADLDDTQIYSWKLKEIEWIGGIEFWNSLYTELSDEIIKAGGRMHLIFVSKKKEMEGVTEEAAKQLKGFLRNENPHMYCNNDGYCLVDVAGKLKYEYLNPDCENIPGPPVPPQAVSNIILTGNNEPRVVKSGLIKKYCQKRKFPLENVVLLDDSKDILDDAKKNGIATVSFEFFGNVIRVDNEGYSMRDTKTKKFLLNTERVEVIDNAQLRGDALLKIKIEIKQKVQSIIARELNKTATAAATVTTTTIAGIAAAANESALMSPVVVTTAPINANK